MIAPMRDGLARAVAQTQPDGGDAVQGIAAPWTEDSQLDRLREVDGNATRGDHECADFGCRDYWALAPEDVPALLYGGEPRWTVLSLCLHCMGAMSQAGWLFQATTRINDAYVVAEIIGGVGGQR